MKSPTLRDLEELQIRLYVVLEDLMEYVFSNQPLPSDLERLRIDLESEYEDMKEQLGLL